MLRKTKIRFGRILPAVCALFIAISLTGSSAFAAASAKSSSSTSASSQTTNGASVQGYASTSPLEIGTIVQLTGAGANSVEPVTQANAGHMYGVTVDPNTLPFTIASSGLQNETYVATSGTYDVLVSTQGGAIQTGDFITVSSIDGVGMAAGTDNTTVFGRAAQPFDGKSNGIGTETLKDTNGSVNQTVTLGVIPVAIQIEHNPTKKSTKVNLPKPLQQLGQAIAQKPISPLKTYLSIGITVLSVIIAIVILYSGVRNSLISIGRNPLSKRSILRGLLEIILTSIIVLIIGLFAVYLLLKL